MEDLLILRLQGVMQAWGDHTFEDYRSSHLFPSRSGLVGLLAACLGIDRAALDAQERLSQSFIYAARADWRPYRAQKITDFHTVMDARKVDGSVNDYPVVSRREYLCDAHFTLALAFLPDAHYRLDELARAVRYPIFTPSLGRRSCPFSRPLFDSVMQATNLHTALAGIPPGRGTIYSELAAGSSSYLVARDVPGFNGRRQFTTRKVYIHASEEEYVSE